MGRRKLKQYSGTLDPAQLAEGMNAALRNARRLTDDARTLVDAERYPTAAAMAVLAIEESGKVGVLRRLAIAPDSEIRRKAWRDYRSHRQKNAAWILPDLVAKGARDLDSLGQGIAPSGDHTAILDQVKQIALYTDCLGDAHWSQPEEVIDEQMACTLVKIAELFARDKTVTTKEVELWIDHLGSTSEDPVEVQKNALLEWFATMRQHGLYSGEMEEVKEFVLGKDRKGASGDQT